MSGPRYVCLEQRLLANSCECPETGCWVWLGAVNAKGYGKLTIRVPAKVQKRHRRRSTATRYAKVPRGQLVHRLAYELFHEVKLLPEQTLDHRCLNRRCFHPNHLYIESVAGNTRLMWARRRFEAEHGARAQF